MSEETKQVETEPKVETPEQNIEKPTEQGDRTVPLHVLTSERKKLQAERDAIKAKLAEAEADAQIARQLQEVSGKDRTALMNEINAIKAKSQYKPPTNQPTNNVESELRELKEMYANDRRERELEKLSKDKLIDIDEDMKEDILNYSKAHNISVREATFARYGDVIVSSKAKVEEKKAKETAANMALTDNSSIGNIFESKTEIELTPDEIKMAKAAGMTPSQYAIFASTDRSVIDDFYKK